MILKAVLDTVSRIGRFPKQSESESINDFITIVNEEILKKADMFKDYHLDDNLKHKPILFYIYHCTYLMKKLTELLMDESVDHLISIQQQQCIKAVLQHIFCLGIHPCLNNGVNIPLLMKSKKLHLIHDEVWSIIEKHELSTFILRTMLSLSKCATLRPLLLEHLGDFLSLLMQRIYCGSIKEPSNVNHETIPDGNTFVMTKDWYDRLCQERDEFTSAFEKFVDSVYQPLIIKELMILLAPSRPKELPIPRWLKKALTTLLNKFLMKPGGVMHIVSACCSSEDETVDWRKVESLSSLITGNPSNIDADLFYSTIAPQVINLLMKTGTYPLPLGKACIRKLLECDFQRSDSYLLHELFKSIVICSDTFPEHVCGVLVSEESLNSSIDNLTKCFTTESNQAAIPMSYLTKFIKIVFKIYTVLAGKPFKLASTLEDLILRFLYSETDLERISQVYNALLFDECFPCMLNMNSSLSIELGPSGGVQICQGTHQEESSLEVLAFNSKYERNCDILVDLLDKNELMKKKLLYDLFYVLLKKLFSSWDFEDTDSLDIKPDLFSAEELILHILSKKEKKLMTVKLLADLSEHSSVKEKVKESPELVIEFLIKVLKQMSSDLIAALNNGEGDEDLNEVVIPLSILDTATVSLTVGSKDWLIFKPFLPFIEIIKEKHPNTQVRKLFGLLYERILTKGAVNKDPIKEFSTSIDVKSFMNIFSSEISSGNKVKDHTSIVHSKKDNAPQKKVLIEELPSEHSLEKIIEIISSEEVPVKGHGLIELERLARNKSPEVVANQSQLFELLKQQLKDPDSYVYLPAVSALEALSMFDAERAVQCLCEEFLSCTKDCSDFQLKVGEVLVRITRSSSNIGASSKERMINTFLFGTKSQDEFLRASSLSNLGDLLKSIGYSSVPILQEVFVCVKTISSSDNSEMVRRAAVLLCKLLIKGYSGSSFLGLEPVLRDLYRTLLHISTTDKDETVRIHARQAIFEIDREVKAQLFAIKPLEKKISILSINK